MVLRAGAYLRGHSLDLCVWRYRLEITSKEQRRAAVVDQIRSAFAGVGREGGVSLHEAEVIDDMGSRRERNRARKLDTDRVWWEVPEADIAYHYLIFCFLDPVGFRYYLP